MHRLRCRGTCARQVARIVGLKQHQVHVIKERVGGGFGSKQDILLEEVCAWATKVTGRPVTFRYTREEEFISNTSRHVAKVKVKVGPKKMAPLPPSRWIFGPTPALTATTH